jgi:hypothetical protein
MVLHDILDTLQKKQFEHVKSVQNTTDADEESLRRNLAESLPDNNLNFKF